MRETLLTVKARRLQTAVAQHPHDLCVLLAFVFEHKLALVALDILSAPAVLAAFAFRLRHVAEKRRLSPLLRQASRHVIGPSETRMA